VSFPRHSDFASNWKDNLLARTEPFDFPDRAKAMMRNINILNILFRRGEDGAKRRVRDLHAGRGVARQASKFCCVTLKAPRARSNKWAANGKNSATPSATPLLPHHAKGVIMRFSGGRIAQLG
jgi:hypothetical protein